MKQKITVNTDSRFLLFLFFFILLSKRYINRFDLKKSRYKSKPADIKIKDLASC